MRKKIVPIIFLSFLFTFLLGCNVPETEMEAESMANAVHETVTAIAESGYFDTPTAVPDEPTVEVVVGDASISEEVQPTDTTVVEEVLPTETETPVPTETVTPTEVVIISEKVVTATQAYDVASYPTSTLTPLPDTSTPIPSATPTTVIIVADEAATPTSIPTITPTITATFACDRAIGRYAATYSSVVPTMDGDLSEWSDDGTTSISTTIYSIPYVVYGMDKWGGNYDLYGNFQMIWNNENLYLAVRAQDERYVQLSNSWQIYEGDSLDILFDRNYCGDYAEKTMNEDDYQIGISPGYIDSSGIKESYRWYPSPNGKVPQIITYTTRTNAYTYYEVMIPWSVFDVYNPVVGNVFGLVLSISDNDDRDENMQESLISSASHRSFSPLTWPMLVLE